MSHRLLNGRDDFRVYPTLTRATRNVVDGAILSILNAYDGPTVYREDHAWVVATYGEWAAALGVSEGTARRAIHRLVENSTRQPTPTSEDHGPQGDSTGRPPLVELRVWQHGETFAPTCHLRLLSENLDRLIREGRHGR
jgi:hypothetical protein